jgi:hypothetical protein
MVGRLGRRLTPDLSRSSTAAAVAPTSTPAEHLGQREGVPERGTSAVEQHPRRRAAHLGAEGH